MRRSLGGRVGSRGVGGFDGQGVDALQDGADLVQGAVCRLDDVDSALGVGLRLLEATDLRLEVLADDKTGSVVRSLVDLVTRRQLVQAALHVRLVDREAVRGVLRHYVGDNIETHFSSMGSEGAHP